MKALATKAQAKSLLKLSGERGTTLAVDALVVVKRALIKAVVSARCRGCHASSARLASMI